MTITPKAEKFCQAIVAGHSQSDAYRAAYDATKMKATTIHKRAFELMQKGAIAGRIAELRKPVVDALQKSRLEWLLEIQRCAFFDIRQLLTEDGRIKPFDQISDEHLPAIAGLEVFEEFEGHGKEREKIGETKKLKLNSRLEALELFGKEAGYSNTLKQVPMEKDPLREVSTAALVVMLKRLEAACYSDTVRLVNP